MGAATILVCDETQTGERSNPITLSVITPTVEIRFVKLVPLVGG